MKNDITISLIAETDEGTKELLSIDIDFSIIVDFPLATAAKRNGHILDSLIDAICAAAETATFEVNAKPES